MGFDKFSGFCRVGKQDKGNLKNRNLKNHFNCYNYK